VYIITGGEGPTDRDAIARLEDAIAVRERALQVLGDQIKALAPLAEREALAAQDAIRDAVERRLIDDIVPRHATELARIQRELLEATRGHDGIFLSVNGELGRAWSASAAKRDASLLPQIIARHLGEWREALDRQQQRRLQGRRRIPQAATAAVWAKRTFHANLKNARDGFSSCHVMRGSIAMVQPAVAEAAVKAGVAELLLPPAGRMRIKLSADYRTSDGRNLRAGWLGCLPADEARAAIASNFAVERTQLIEQEIAEYRGSRSGWG
jgi:hypothetical protein